MIVKFSDLYIPTCVGKIYGVHFPRKLLNLCFFTHNPVPHSKLLVEFFVFPKTEGVEGSYDLLCQNPIRNYEDDLEH